MMWQVIHSLPKAMGWEIDMLLGLVNPKISIFDMLAALNPSNPDSLDDLSLPLTMEPG